MLTIHVWPRWVKEFLLTHPLYKSPVISQCAHADKQPMANRYRKDHPERKNAFPEVKSRRSENEDDRDGDEHPHRFRTTAARKQPRAERSCKRRAVTSHVMFESGHLRMHGMIRSHQYRQHGKRQYYDPRLVTRQPPPHFSTSTFSLHLLLLIQASVMTRHSMPKGM